MRRFRHYLCLLAAALVALAVGCAGRGPSNTGGGGRPSSGSGPLAALPPPNPDPLGYDLASAALNGVTNGQVGALAPRPGSASASLAAHEPLHAIASVSSLSATAEVSLPFPLTSLASVGSLCFAGTGDPAVAGAGDVYRRVESTPGAPAWARVLDGSLPAAVVAVGSNELLVALGGPGVGASLVRLEPATPAVIASTGLGALEPRAVIEFPAGSGTVWVGGAAGNDVGLVRVRAGAVEPIALPIALPAAGTRQEVRALLRAPAAGGGELLVVAVAGFDATTGAPLAGQFLLHDGTFATGLPDLSGDAPLALAFQDDTLVAGTAQGRLLLLDPGAGTWSDVPGFPAVDRVTSLLARDRRHLLVGCQSVGGALLVIRTGRTP